MSGGEEEPYMRFVPKEFSKAPIANKDDWASLFKVLRDETAWSLPSGDQKQKKDGTGASQVVVGGSGVVASLTHGSQSLTREVLHKRMLADVVQVQGNGGTAATASFDPKSTYEISLDGLRLCNLGVNTARKGADNSGPSDAERKQFLEIARTSALAEFRELRKLTVNNNKIEDAVAVEVLLSCLPELRELQLDFNSLDRIPLLSALPKLEQLTVVHNQMTTAGDSLTSLKLNTLDLTSNRLTKLPGTIRLPMLTTLTLRNNSFANLESLSALTHLTSLDVSFNQLNSLSGIDTMTNLVELSASDNQLRSSALQAHKNPLRAVAAKLESLDVSNNRISSLGFFPSSGFPKLWSLNLAHNAFHGEKSARPEPGTPPPASKAGTVSSKPGRLGKQTKKAQKKSSNLGFDSDSESSASSDLTDGLGDLDDFGESLYGDDATLPESTLGDSPSKATSKSVATTVSGKTKMGGKVAHATSKTAPVGSSASVTSTTTTGLAKAGRPSSTAVSVAGKSTATAKKPSTPPTEPEVSFLTKVTTLFPSLEALDVSSNSSDLIPEYSELTTLSKIATFSELGISGTLDMGPARQKQHREAIQAFLPDIRVIDGTELEGVTKPEVTDMTSGSSRPTSAAGPRPMSAAGLRPTSAIRKTTTVRKKELNEFRDQLVDFLNDASKTREKCNNVLDFLDASVAWAFEGQEMPDEDTYLKYGKSGKAAAAAKEEAKALDDLEKQLKCDETMAAVRAHQEKKANDKSSPTKSETVSVRAQSSSAAARQRTPSQHALVARKPPGEVVNSPGNKARLRASSSHSTASVARSQGRAMSVTASSTMGGEKTRAMEKIQKERTMMRPSFASEQKKFREAAKKESEERLRQILEMTGNNKAQEVVQKHKKKVAEAGTTMSSPEKGATSSNRASTSSPASAMPPALSDDELLRKTESFLTRAMSSGGERVSAGVGTTPPKSSAPVPSLAIKGSEADRTNVDVLPVSSSTTTGGAEESTPEIDVGERDFEEALEDVLAQDDLDPKVKEILIAERERRKQLLAEDQDDLDDEDDDDDGLLMHVTGDPRFMATNTESSSQKVSPTAPNSTVEPLKKRSSVDGEVLRPTSASIKQRQEMGKSHRRLGETPKLQETEESTAVPHTSLVLSRYETGAPGKFSLKNEIKKGASGWNSANAQLQASKATQQQDEKRPTSSTTPTGVTPGSRVLQPKHRVSNNTGGLLVKGGGKVVEEEKKSVTVAGPTSIQRPAQTGTSLNRRQR